MTDLPPTLDRFGPQLENAVRRDLRVRRARRRVAGTAGVLAAVAAVALGILSALPSGGPSVVQRAAAALQSSDDSILHYQVDAQQQNGDGTSVGWSSETWQLRVPPYTRRQIEVQPGSPRAESVTRGGLNELYDSSNDTIYVATSKALRAARMPTIEIVPRTKLERLTGSSNADAVYEVGKGGGSFKVLVTRQGAERVRKEFARPPGRSSGELPDEFRSEILALLNSRRVQMTGRFVVDGRDAIRLASPDGKQVYVVDASTYDPIEWTTKGDGGGVTLRFPVYEELPVDAGSLQLLDLQAQHPGATVVRDAKAYIAAESRLYPHG
jgi:hypothetical protein